MRVVSAGSILREARARAGLTQRQLAVAAETPQPAIARIESGARDPSLATLERLVEAAGFDLRIELVPHIDRSRWPARKPPSERDPSAELLIKAIFKEADLP